MALSSSTATAQAIPQRWEIFAEGGVSITNNHYIDSTSALSTVRNTTHIPTSGRLFTGFRFWFNDHEALEVSYSYTPANIVQTSFCEDVNCGGSIIVSPTRANFFSTGYVRSFRVRNRLRPFLTAGIGLLYVHQVYYTFLQVTVKNGAYEPDPFTVNLGGGLDVRIEGHWFFRAEYRDWLFEGIRENDFFATGATGLTHNQVPSIGFSYRF